MLQVAESKNIYDKLIAGDITTELPLITNQDLILAADVLTYFGDLSNIINQCYNSLNSKGLIGFTLESLHSKQQYTLQHSIRYAHNYEYILQALTNAGFINININSCTLRQQFKQPVNGYAIIAEKDESKHGIEE